VVAPPGPVDYKPHGPEDKTDALVEVLKIGLEDLDLGYNKPPSPPSDLSELTESDEGKEPDGEPSIHSFAVKGPLTSDKLDTVTL